MYGPAAYYCKIHNEKCSIMIENAVGSFKLLQFVVLNHHDGDFLKDYFKRCGWRIDVSVMNMQYVDLQGRIQHSRNELNSLRNADVIQQLGIQGLVSDVVF